MVKRKTKKLFIRKRKIRGGVSDLPIFTSEYKGITKVCPSGSETDKYCKYIVPRNLLPDTVGKSLFNKNRWEDIVQAVDTKSKLNAYNDVAADIGFEQLSRERVAAEGSESILPGESEGEALIGETTPLKKRPRITNQNPEMPPPLPEPPSPVLNTNPVFLSSKPSTPITGDVPKSINLPIKKSNDPFKSQSFVQMPPNLQGGKGKHKTRKNKTKKNLKKSKKSRKYRK